MADITELRQYIDSKNLCDELTEKELDEIGKKVILWFDDDEEARSEWKTRNDAWMKLATQVMENKTYPWPNSANVKYPLLTTAAMQFAARAYPALVPGPNLVSGLVIGRDEGGMKGQSAERVGRHMSYQLMYEMPGWEEDMDRLCITLPIVGCLFKKTYYDPLKKQNVSELVLPNDLVIDYYAKSIEEATHKSHIIYRTNNQLVERVNAGLFRDVDLGEPKELFNTDDAKNQMDGTKEPQISDATPYKLIECHCAWDLDDDGYDEPYIITVHYDSQKVLRIVARFGPEQIVTEADEKGKEKLIKITPIEYFTKFGFIPNPDGGIYDLGFGLLLGGINDTINTLTNQLLDSGTMHNLQAGFMGRGIRIRGGNSKFQPGEWKPVDFTGDDIKKHIFPLPAKEPSETLFKLLETLVTSGKELASVAEIMVGKMPGQNTPATTTMATIEQGLKVFTAIYKRVYRALGKEYEKLFRLNSINLDEKVFFTINEPQGPVSQEVNKTDYSPDNIAVKPNADPNVVSSAQKMMKVESMGALLQLQTINPQEYTKRYLEAIDAENISALMNVQPQPDPEVQKIQMEAQMKEKEMNQKLQIEQQLAQLDMQVKQMEMEFKKMELQLKAQELQMKVQATQAQSSMDMQVASQEHTLDMEMQKEQHSMDKELAKDKMSQQKELGEQKLAMQKQQAAAKPKTKE